MYPQTAYNKKEVKDPLPQIWKGRSCNISSELYLYIHTYRRQKGGKLHSFRKLYLGSLWAGSFVWLGKQSKKLSLALNFEVFFLNVVDGDTGVHVTMHNVCHHQYKNTTMFVMTPTLSCFVGCLPSCTMVLHRNSIVFQIVPPYPLWPSTACYVKV